MIELNDQQKATNLLSHTRFADLDITLTPHRSIISSQGLISDPELMNETETNLLEGLKSLGVIAVRRITIRRQDKKIPTKHLSLTYHRTTLPEFINAAYIKCSIRP